MKGIDVSHHQGEIDWAKVAGAGVEFTWIRCAYGCREDRRVREYWDKSEGKLLRGVYQYYRADQDGLDQADFALHYGNGMELPMVLDVERDDLFDESSPQKIASDIETWIRRVMTWRGSPWIYTNSSWQAVAPYVDGWIYDECKLWIADLAESPRMELVPPWQDWACWQCSHTALVHGIKGHVDLNIMRDGAIKHGAC